ncbi:type III-A CRISPR-associated RAMP protein Csm4 [Syntrophobacter fumaroxidans]|uniref:CRISPR system Cms protein Csm4 n=1 Tax=Syntrophobacter fumaroxidans (strain DSM 10017 / MPOB) TaxID=335543 RepID=A0LHY5_SYNFM|nr:hypothetical protein [Syntrophobacter fumaroxidans]ABK17037.1 Uncharacterized protein predicted to be involved in DNA repair (RAMP superfamily)-like [Syntrophobacter fumaroxidans MPOB]
MPTYRITLNLKGPLGTKMVSGTFWGHLAWAICYIEGEKSLTRWLEEQETRPWVLSSQMPLGMLPKPLLRPTLRMDAPPTLKEMQLDKDVRKVSFIPEGLFLDLREGMNDVVLNQALKSCIKQIGVMRGPKGHGLKAHNHIDRLAGTTPDTGGLFFEEVLFSGETRQQVFLLAPEACKARLEALCGYVGASGFGSNASTGNGHFVCTVEEETTLFAASGNRAMSLSHGVISANMRRARYKQHVHFGKLGGDLAKGRHSPFKYPILMASPGATFEPGDGGPYGALLRDVHHDPLLVHVRHHAFHLPLAFTELNP